MRWDGITIPKISINDLDDEAFEFFRKRAFKCQRLDRDNLSDSNEHLIENLHLTEAGLLKRAAILLFHSKPEKFITGAYIKIGCFQSDDDLQFQDEIRGNLFEQIEKTMDLLFTKYIKSEISYVDINRLEKFQYPKEALREALLNAFAHKDYSGGVPIQISVYNEKIIFWNEGHLPNNWTVKTLFEKHASRPYNPDIANALFRCGYIESWGRGTIKIIKECKIAGIPEPLFRYNSSEISVEFKKDFVNKSHLKSLGLSERQIKAVLYVKGKEKITNREYQSLNRCSRNTASNDLADLIEKKILKSSGIRGAGANYKLIGILDSD